MPGSWKKAAEFKAAGVDELWCLAVNDATLSWGAWARDQKTGGVIRMLADGDAALCQGHRPDAGFAWQGGWACAATAIPCWSKDGKVVQLNIEGPGKFEVSDAATLLAQAQA